MVASAPLLLQFVSEGAARDHELRKRGTSEDATLAVQRGDRHHHHRAGHQAPHAGGNSRHHHALEAAAVEAVGELLLSGSSA